MGQAEIERDENAAEWGRAIKAKTVAMLRLALKLALEGDYTDALAIAQDGDEDAQVDLGLQGKEWAKAFLDEALAAPMADLYAARATA